MSFGVVTFLLLNLMKYTFFSSNMNASLEFS